MQHRCNTSATQLFGSMANFYPYIKKGYKLKSGHTPLYIRYNYNRVKRTLIATGFSIKFKHWDDDKKNVRKSCPEYDKIQSVLNKVGLQLTNILDYANENNIEPTVDFVQKELTTEREYKQESDQANLFDFLEKYIEEKAAMVSKDQIKDYKTLRKHLTRFKEYSSQSISFINLNLKFYTEFMNYLFYRAVKPDGTVGLVTNSAGKMIRILKGFVNYQIAKGVIPAIDMKNFKAVGEETFAIYLNEAELAKIYELSLSEEKELDEIRDVFMVGCFTGIVDKKQRKEKEGKRLTVRNECPLLALNAE